MTIFKTTYDSLPGDFTEAGQFWGASCGGDTSAPTGCNGNGDNKIGYYSGSSSKYNSIDERFRFWQHLNLAELSNQKTLGIGAGSSKNKATSAGLYNSAAITGALYNPQFSNNWNSAFDNKNGISLYLEAKVLD